CRFPRPAPARAEAAAPARYLRRHERRSDHPGLGPAAAGNICAGFWLPALAPQRAARRAAHYSLRGLLYGCPAQPQEQYRFAQRGSWPGFFAQLGVSNLIDAIIEKGQPRAQQSDAQSRRQEPPPRSLQEGAAVLRKVEHRSPANAANVAQANIFQASFGQDGIESCPAV